MQQKRSSRETIDLDQLIPDFDDAPLRLRKSLFRRLLRIAGIGLGCLILLIILFGTYIYFIGINDIGSDRLRQQARSVLTRMAGANIDVELGELNLSFASTEFLRLEVHDATLSAEDGKQIASIGNLRFGIKALPLLRGQIEINRISVKDAVVSQMATHFFTGQEQQIPEITPASLEKLVFDSLNGVIFAANNAGLDRVRITNLQVLFEEIAGNSHDDITALSPQASFSNLNFKELDLTIAGKTNMLVKGIAHYDDNSLQISGKLAKELSTGFISDLDLSLKLSRISGSAVMEGPVAQFDEVELALKAGENSSEGRWLLLDSNAANVNLILGKDQFFANSIRIQLGFHGSDKVFTVMNSFVRSGRNNFNFEGTVTPGQEGEYQIFTYDFATRNAVLAPADSPEPTMPFIARIAGRVLPHERKIEAERVEVRTAKGSVSANASFIFPAGLAPGISLSMDVDRIATSEAKQLWPWFSAPGARDWVLNNLFGGTVYNSHLQVEIPPGRLGSGVPLGREEVFGRFLVTDTRFDLVEDLPPVRNSDGWVEFYGTDVDVGLTTGTAYLPSGKIVHASKGRLGLLAAHQRPRIGKLKIDIAGNADAVAEFASLKPLTASFMGLSPQDISGQVSGHVIADIPLHDGIPSDRLNWDIELTYEDLSLARPIEGQKINAASGLIHINKSRADIQAKAELNGMPADIQLIEPLGSSKSERTRHIKLNLDDGNRDKLFPALKDLLSGSMDVEYEQKGKDNLVLNVDLTNSQLDVPWIGWQKGKGIPAKASFLLHEQDAVTELRNFKLTGDGFNVSGDITLAKNQLQKANLTRVSFNRDDNFQADIRAEGAGYVVTIKGKSLDARSVVKMLLGNDQAPQKNDTTPITLNAELDALHGFHGVVLEKANVQYSSQSDQLSVRAATPTYGSVRFGQRYENGKRVMALATENGGSVLRFLDIYEFMEDGRLSLSLTGTSDHDLKGRMEIRDFWVVNEPRLGSLVAASSKSRTARSDKVDVKRVQFDTAAADLMKGQKRLDVAQGVLRGPLIGLSFQGTLFDANNRTAMTGTFMPLYGLNRIFGEIPIIGQILGNGRDRGLIGITFRLIGDYKDPRLEVNPISVIAPGIFRQIFEFSK